MKRSSVKCQRIAKGVNPFLSGGVWIGTRRIQGQGVPSLDWLETQVGAALVFPCGIHPLGMDPHTCILVG